MQKHEIIIDKELRQQLQLCIAEAIRLLRENKIQEALVVLHYADQLMDQGSFLLSENKQTFFVTNIARLHDAARFLSNSKMIAPLVATTKNDLLESSEDESSSDGKQEITESNNNNSKSKKCHIL